MNINEQELAEAVDKLWEGDDNGLLIKKEDVFKLILKNEGLTIEIFDFLTDGHGAVFGAFRQTFNDHARDLLTEALRTHKEQKAGLM